MSPRPNPRVWLSATSMLLALACGDRGEPTDHVCSLGIVKAAGGETCQPTPDGKTCNHLAESLHGNAWTTNPDATAALRQTALAAVDDDTYLMRQLVDPAAVDVARELVRCALTPDQAITWSARVTGEPEWRGQSGLCPRWLDGPIDGDSDCQERVSACLLAKNNPSGEPIPIGLRGVIDGQPLVHDQLWTTVAVPGVASFSPCGAGDGQPASLADDCGWSAQPVGRCHPGDTVTVRVEDGICDTQPPLVRVCEGAVGCDSDSPDLLAAVADACAGGVPLTFVCGPTGGFALMTGKIPLTLAEDVNVSVTSARYPLRESDVLSIREGAFFGNLFGPNDIDPGFRVYVEDRQVIYEYQGQVIGAWDACAGTGNDLEARRALHREFVRNAAIPDTFHVHPNAYTCSDWRFASELAELENRVCTQHGDNRSCVARALGECIHGADSVCQGEHGADRDYFGCADDQGRPYQNPITVFVASACELLPGLCDQSGEYLRAAVLAVTDDHGCMPLHGLDSQGARTTRIRCWGGDTYGETGHGQHVGDDGLPSAVGHARVFADEILDLQTTSNHTCALDVNGGIECWGQMGDAIAITAGPGATGLALTESHVYVLMPDQTVACYDYAGTACQPLALAGIEQLATSPTIACARDTAGRVDCWNSPSTATWNAFPAGASDVAVASASVCALLDSGSQIACTGDIGIQSPVPGRAREIAAGNGHVCVLLDSGRVHCWGDNTWGQLGVGPTGSPGDGVILGDHAVHIAAGTNHVCAILDDEHGTIRCWGENSVGQLGCGHTEPVGDDEHPIQGCDVAH